MKLPDSFSRIINWNPLIQQWYIRYQEWLAQNPDAVAVRLRVEKILWWSDINPKNWELLSYAIENWNIWILDTSHVFRSFWQENLIFDIIRTLRSNTQIAKWIITLPEVSLLSRNLIDLLNFYGFGKISISPVDDGQVKIKCVYSNPSRSTSEDSSHVKNSKEVQGDNSDSDDWLQAAA